MSSPTPSLAERLQRSALGPAIRGVVSRAKTGRWRAAGSPPPAPPHIKLSTVQEYAKRFKPSAFVETGTYRGDTVAGLAPLVPRVVSIELDERLATLAKARFVDDVNIDILQGDSAQRLPEIVADLREPALFWLDGHFSGGATAGDGACPIVDELTTVLSTDVDHIVLVDDARLFDGTDAYPTIDEVRELVEKLRPGIGWQVEDDIIRLHS
ncbi:MAG TPA: hypothetical protein PLV93_05290 [Microthrixaceae bacterium]|nr:hypothetical protein [Microthrixaceae bacterium]HNI34790.1 hypothetical protein [Microthrixaceae bacterium]